MKVKKAKFKNAHKESVKIEMDALVVGSTVIVRFGRTLPDGLC